MPPDRLSQELRGCKMQLVVVHQQRRDLAVPAQGSISSFLQHPSSDVVDKREAIIQGFFYWGETPMVASRCQIIAGGIALLGFFSICFCFSDASNSARVTLGLVPKRCQRSPGCSFLACVLLRLSFHPEEQRVPRGRGGFPALVPGTKVPASPRNRQLLPAAV